MSRFRGMTFLRALHAAFTLSLQEKAKILENKKALR